MPATTRFAVHLSFKPGRVGIVALPFAVQSPARATTSVPSSFCGGSPIGRVTPPAVMVPRADSWPAKPASREGPENFSEAVPTSTLFVSKPAPVMVRLQVPEPVTERSEGKTNKEVGAALFLSHKTVEFHLSRIYRKLDFNSRAELIRRLPSRASGPPSGPGEDVAVL